jgi:hypothetical protein
MVLEQAQALAASKRPVWDALRVWGGLVRVG